MFLKMGTPMKKLIDFEILKANCGHKTALGNNPES
jgi:hypothetical protein